MREAENQDESDIFKELMRTSLFRAKVCEKIARLQRKENFSEYFLVGLFSLIDSLLKRPMNLILGQLPLSENIAETISGTTTQMTPYLQFSIALNKLDWDRLDHLASELNISKDRLIPIYDEVNEWVNDAFV